MIVLSVLGINMIIERIKFKISRNDEFLGKIQRLFDFKSKKLTPIGLLIICIQLFVWFNMLFMTNNIKTNKVSQIDFEILK